jgi:hypothetical protein
MKKKLAYALIMALLVMTLLPPSAAAEIPTKSDTLVKDRLGTVTMIVKQTIEIGDHYTNFNGTLQEDVLNSYWNLNWSSDSDNLTIYALESGKIMQYSRYMTQDGIYKSYSPFFEPAFPKNSKVAALEVAKKFVDRVLTAGETADFSKVNAQESLSATQYYFSGSILLNGLESGLSFNININSDDLMVQSFYRSDSYSKIIGDVPSKEISISQEAAAWLLKGKIGLKLQYVLVENDVPPVSPMPRPMPVDVAKPEMAPDAGNVVLPNPDPRPEPQPEPTEPKTYTAVLRYLPFIEGNWMVDAKTGELIDINTLYSDLKGRDEMSSSSPTPGLADGKGGYEEYLTPTEIEGVEKLKDALSKEKLTEMLFQIEALKMDSSYQLSSYNFYLNESNGDITASLNFNKIVAGSTKLFSYKYASMNAKTGELLSFSSTYPYLEETMYDITGTKESAEAAARLFLEEYATEHFAVAALYDSYVPEKPDHYANAFQFTYAHSVNGYFLASNTINVSINAQSGAIDNFYQSWTDGVVFDSAEGIIAEPAAIDIYANAHETKLQYLQLPAAIDPESPLYEPLKAYGYGYIYEYRLAYQYANDAYIYGIDAKTGEILEYTYDDTLELPKYNDIAGHYAEQQITTLAQYGIGFSGESFLPNQDLTQRELLIFILSATNSRTELENNEDYLYNQAYSMNMLTKEERNPGATVDKSELVKAILNMSGYGKVAKIPGIFVVKFNDQATIETEDYGYVAIAQGLKLVYGDLLGNFNPQQNASRAMAAIVYYNFLNR